MVMQCTTTVYHYGLMDSHIFAAYCDRLQKRNNGDWDIAGLTIDYSWGGGEQQRGCEGEGGDKGNMMRNNGTTGRVVPFSS